MIGRRRGDGSRRSGGGRGSRPTPIGGSHRCGWGGAGAEGAGHRGVRRALRGGAMIARGVLELPAPSAIGYVPEDRHRDGLVLDFSLTENVALRGAGHRRGRIRWRTLRDETAALIAAFDVRAARIGMPVRALSGGNQQKLVL